MLADSRSGAIPLGPVDLTSIPGLTDALNGLTEDMMSFIVAVPKAGFDLKRYQGHIEAYNEKLDAAKRSWYVMAPYACRQVRCYYSSLFHAPYKIPG